MVGFETGGSGTDHPAGRPRNRIVHWRDARRGVCIFGAEAATRGDETTWPSISVFGLRSDRSEDDLLLARSMLDEATFAACWSEGQAMTLDQAIACALEAVPALA